MADPVWQVRVMAASALGKVGGSAAVPALGGAFEHEISNLRKEAAAALGEIGDQAGLPWLQRAANDPDPDVRKLIQWAMERCKAA